jgi:ARG and Rhodanese-Phosphatase-superfamily-associated Protein domain
MKNLGRFGLAAAMVLALAAYEQGNQVKAAGGGPEAANGPYRVLAPIESGNLLLFPVVRAAGKSPGETPFITLDEGIKSGEVEVTEAGRVQGLVRPRHAGTSSGVPPQFHDDRYRGYPEYPDYSSRGDQVNTLVLVNNSNKPLLLLAGEIVTGGKQDRVIAKDRIVPAGADPIDLSVFCIEPGRWTESSPTFGAAAKASKQSFMVQPTVRERAMVEKDQQQVWDSVHGAISQMEMATAAPRARTPGVGSGGGVMYDAPSIPAFDGTTSYAKVMESSAVSEKVDQAAAPVMKAREQVLAKLREEHAVGVVVAVHGEIVWADLFTDTDLLARYWTKLVRSYAAESLTEGENHPAPSVVDAQHFLDAPAGGTETSEGDVGVYRYRELKSGGAETFVLESLLPGTGYDVHISKMRLITPEYRIKHHDIYR